MPTNQLDEIKYTCIGRFVPGGENSTTNAPSGYDDNWNGFVISLFGKGNKERPLYPYLLGIQIILTTDNSLKTYKRFYWYSLGAWTEWTTLL